MASLGKKVSYRISRLEDEILLMKHKRKSVMDALEDIARRLSEIRELSTKVLPYGRGGGVAGLDETDEME